MLLRTLMLSAVLPLLLVAVGCSATEEPDEPADAAATDEEIVGIVWHWSSTTSPIDTITVDDPAKYQLTLSPDGTAQIQADCNGASTTYTLEGSTLTFGPMAATMAECGPESLSNRFLQEIGAAAIYFMDQGDLLIDLMYDSGTMRLTDGGSGPDN